MFISHIIAAKSSFVIRLRCGAQRGVLVRLSSQLVVLEIPSMSALIKTFLFLFLSSNALVNAAADFQAPGSVAADKEADNLSHEDGVLPFFGA